MRPTSHPGSNQAHIFQINTSNCGVPKLARRAAEVGFLGLSGDHQSNQEVHGGPERAVCLYSLERILALQEEGHPLYPGAAGENVTVAGLDWEAIVPGVRLRLGEQVLLEITRYTNPCSNIAPWFQENDSNRIAQKKFPGWSRVYARVLQGGVIQVGNRVQVVKQS